MYGCGYQHVIGVSESDQPFPTLESHLTLLQAQYVIALINLGVINNTSYYLISNNLFTDIVRSFCPVRTNEGKLRFEIFERKLICLKNGLLLLKTYL